jgi:hypothetical protein
VIDALALYKPVPETPGQALQVFLWPAIVFVLSTALMAILIGVIVALIQSRGATGWAVLNRTSRRECRKNPATSLLGLILAFNVACCVAYVVVPKLLQALAPPGKQPTAVYLGELLHNTAKLVVVASLVLAVVLLFVSRLTFLVGLKSRARRLPVDDT